MATVGRNDPCPCGSGRKYKQCCWPKDRAKQVRDVAVQRDDELVWLRLLDYLGRASFFVDARSAFSRFWDGDFDLRTSSLLERQAMEAFLEWYAYDYPTSKDRRRIVEAFRDEEGPRLTPAQRALLDALAASYLGLYTIEDARADGELRLGDLLAGATHLVLDAGLARLAAPGDMLLGRRYSAGEHDRLSRGTVLLPGTLSPELVGVARRAFSTYGDGHYQATWPEFMRESGYMLFHYLSSPEAAPAYGRAKHEGYFDPRPGVERMREATRRLAEERARAEAKDAGQERSPEAGPRVERTAGGILIPGQPKPPSGGEGGILLPGQARQ